MKNKKKHSPQNPHVNPERAGVALQVTLNTSTLQQSAKRLESLSKLVERLSTEKEACEGMTELKITAVIGDFR